MAETGPADVSAIPDASERIGREIGRGFRSVIYESGAKHVVKVPDRATPPEWIREELRLADSAARSGAPVPMERRLADVEHRACLVMRRIHGPSLWDLLRDSPDRADEWGRRLAEVQLELLALPPSYELPGQRDRIAAKIHRAAREHGATLRDAISLMPESDRPLALCHGDLHPLNVLLGNDRTWVVDWFDASRGDPAAEVARTSVLLESSRLLLGPLSSPDRDAAVDVLHHAYLAMACDALNVDRSEVGEWRTIQRVARLAEGFGVSSVPEIETDLDRLRALRSSE